MTPNELSRRILLSIGVVGETDTLTAEQADDTFQSINQFLSSLGAQGFVTAQYPNPTADIGLDDGWEEMIQTNVAMMVAPDYGKEASASIQRRAISTKRTLKRPTTSVPFLNLDAVRQLQRNGWGYNILADDYSSGYFASPPDYVLPPPGSPSPPPSTGSGYYPSDYGPSDYVQ